MPDVADIRSEIEIKDVPDQPVLLIRERAPLERLSEVIPGAFKEIAAYLHGQGQEPIGPPITICPYADEEGMVSVENTWPVAPGSPGRAESRPRRFPRAPCSRTTTGGTTRSSIARIARSRRSSNGST